MTTPLVLLGAGGHAVDVALIIDRINAAQPTFELVGLLDDGAPDLTVFAAQGLSLLGRVERLADLAAADHTLQYVAAVGSPGGRRSIIAAVPDGMVAATVIDPLAVVASSAELGEGVFVAFHATIGPGAVLERHVHVSHAAVVGTGVRIGAFSGLLPHAVLGDGAVVGRDVTVGTGVVIEPGVRIGDDAVVGGHAVVTDDVPPGATVVGDPARPVVR